MLDTRPTIFSGAFSFNAIKMLLARAGARLSRNILTFSRLRKPCRSYTDSSDQNYLDWRHAGTSLLFDPVDFQVRCNILSDDQRTVLEAEAAKLLKKRRYEDDHWDSAIVGFREMERSRFSICTSKRLETTHFGDFTAGGLQRVMLPWIL
eukprot:m.45188 g.45188  ORF g.45188 m.45188 type:complete len:150 (-) comp10205_c0_seq2:692-1141(-)